MGARASRRAGICARADASRSCSGTERDRARVKGGEGGEQSRREGFALRHRSLACAQLRVRIFTHAR